MRKKIGTIFIILILMGCASISFIAENMSYLGIITPSPMTVHAESDTEPSASASEIWENPETGYSVLLEDDAELLSAEERSQLAAQMQEITVYGNAAFKTISYNMFSASTYARDFYHDSFGQSSGTLFLIDMDNRELYIFSDGSVYRTITSSYADTITDNVYRYASRGDYYACASNAFEQIHSLLAGQKIARPMKYISNALLALILAALINYFLAMNLSRSAKASSSEILGAISTKFSFRNPRKDLVKQDKVYSPPSSSSSGYRISSSGGGHRSSGGGGHHSGGGGHRSGGGGGHRF